MKKRPPKPKFTLSVMWFTPTPSGTRHSVPDLESMHHLLASFQNHEQLVIYLDRNEGESGSVWVHLTGNRAWVTHWEQLGGPDAYCKDVKYRGPNEMVGFLLSNGQLDEIHRRWTVTRAEALGALDYFFQHGERDPALYWVQEPDSLQE